MMVLEGVPTRHYRRMYMGQTPAPEATPALVKAADIPITPLGAALTEFYQDVTNAYDIASKSILASKDGKTDEGRVLLTQARAWTDKAWDQLELLKSQRLLSEDEVADLQAGVMKPLGNCQGKYNKPGWWEFWVKTGSYEPCDVLAIAAAAVERGKSLILEYWDKTVAFGANITAKFMSFLGGKLEKGIELYAGLVRYNNTTRNGLEELKAGLTPDAIVRLEIPLRKSELFQRSIEELFKSYGITQKTLNEGAGLGAGPAAPIAITVTGVIAAALGGGRVALAVAAILAFILHTIAQGIVFHFSGNGTIPAWVTLQSDAEQMEKQIRLQQGVYAKLDKERADAAMAQAKKQDDIAGGKLKEQFDQLKQLNTSVGAYSPEQMKKLEESLKVHTAGSADVSEYMPYILAGGAGLILAFVLASRGRK